MRAFLIFASAPVLLLSTQGLAGGYGIRVPKQTNVRVDRQLDRQLERIGGRVRDGRESGQLSRPEARQLRREKARIRSMWSRFGSNGLSPAESTQLQYMANYLGDTVTVKRTVGGK